jgi:hypothetical protein
MEWEEEEDLSIFTAQDESFLQKFKESGLRNRPSQTHFLDIIL